MENHATIKAIYTTSPAGEPLVTAKGLPYIKVGFSDGKNFSVFNKDIGAKIKELGKGAAVIYNSEVNAQGFGDLKSVERDASAPAQAPQNNAIPGKTWDPWPTYLGLALEVAKLQISVVTDAAAKPLLAGPEHICEIAHSLEAGKTPQELVVEEEMIDKSKLGPARI